jgi:hypothetical protein
VLALATLALAGRWPDWGPYLAFFSTYGNGDVTEVASIVHPWSAGFGVGAVYFASTLAALTVAVRRPALAREKRALFVAIAASTSLGIVTLTYLVSHGLPSALLSVALPAAIVGALWLALIDDLRRAVPRAARMGALALGVWLAAASVVFAWPQARPHFRQTALWQALPGTEGLQGNLRRLWSSPRIDPRSADAEALLARDLPGQSRVPVLIEPDLAVETLVRTRRANTLPLGDLIQDGLIFRHTLPRLNRAIDHLRAGTLVLVQMEDDRRIVPLASNPVLGAAFARLHSRFDLPVVDTTASGLTLVRLAPRGPPGAKAP